MNILNKSWSMLLLFGIVSVQAVAYPKPEKVKDALMAIEPYRHMSQEAFNSELFDHFALSIERVSLLRSHDSAESISQAKERMKAILLTDYLFNHTLTKYNFELNMYADLLQDYDTTRLEVIGAPDDKAKQNRLHSIKILRNKSFTALSSEYSYLVHRYMELR